MAEDIYLASTGSGPGSGTGVVRVARGKVPTVIDGRKVVRAAMIGTSATTPDQLKRNWQAVDSAIDPRLLGADIDKVLGHAAGAGSSWFHGMAEPGVTADWTPTTIVVGAVAGLGTGSIIARAIGARGAAAAGGAAGAEAGGEAAGAATTATAGGVAGGAAAKAGEAVKKAAGVAVKNPKGVLGALTIASLFTNIGLWKGLGLTVAGAVLILIGILQLSGMSAGVAARRVIA